MPQYEVSIPGKGTFRIDSPEELSEYQVYSAALQNTEKKTTVLGNVKEAFKGLVPGAVSLVEGAVTGASAMLPDEYEKATREKTKQIASAIKAPFAAAPGYEDSVVRKLSESVGSTAPFFAMGPLGLAGRLAAVGTGVAAGAGEARTRAEESGATQEERRTATGLGAVVGSTEALPVFSFLNKLGKPAADALLDKVRRAAVTGGQEGAQEIVSAALQNAIAKGVYKPDQSIIEGTGEAGAYGAGTGAIIQGITDMALGRRARGAKAPAPGEAPPVAPIDAARIAEEERLAQEAAKANLLSEDYIFELASGPNGYAEVAKYKAGLLNSKKTPEVKAALATATKLLQAEDVAEYNRIIRDRQDLTAAVKERGLPTPETSAFNLPTEEVVETSAETEVPPPKVRKKGAKNVAVPPVVESGEATAIEPDGAGATVPGMGVDSQPDAVTAPVQTEAAGVGVSELPVTDGNEPQGLANPTVKLEDGRSFTVTNQDENKFTLQGGGQTTSVMRGSNLGKFIEAQLAPVAEVPTPVVEVPAVEAPAAIEAPAVVETPAVEALAEQPAPIETPAAEEPAAPTETPAPTVESLTAERDKLLTPKGRVPAPKSKNRAAYDALQVQIDELTPTPERNPYESAVRADLTPQKEKQLRIDYAAAKQEADRLEKEMDKFYFKLFEGQDFYTDGQKEAINAQKDAAGKLFAKAVNKADRLYSQLYDTNKAEQEGKVGETYVDAENAKRAETARLAKAPVEKRGSYPYNLTSLEAVRDEVRDQMSHMPEYKKYIEKYFTVDRSRVKNKVREEDAIAEGQRLIATRTLYNVESLNNAAPTPDGFAEAAAKGQTRKALQAVLNHPQADPITKLVINSILKAGTLPKLSVVPEGTFGVDAESKKVRVGEYDPVSDTIRLDAGYVTAANLIHEVMHGFLHRKIVDHTSGVRKDAQVQRIEDLFKYLSSNHPELAESYGMTDLSEFTSEVMSNGSFQDKLRDIPYKKSNVFREFAKAVLKLLGINDTTPKWNALAEALISTESVMQSGRLLQEARTGIPDAKAVSNISTPGAVAAAANANVIGDTTKRTAWDDIKRAVGNISGVQFIDRLRSIDAKLSAGYLGRLRDSLGNINPKELLAQALDAPRLVERALVEGFLSLTPDGMFVASEGELANGERASLKRIVEIIAASAKQSGRSFEEENKVLSAMIVGHREYELDKYNNAPTTPVPIQLRIDDPLKRNELERQFQANADAKKVLEIMDAMRFNRIDMMVYSGRISQDKADFWKSTLGYIPYQDLDRLNERINAQKTGNSKGLANTSKFMRLEGSDTQVNNVVESFVDLMSRMTLDAVKVNAVNRSAEAMRLLGHAKRISPTVSQSQTEKEHTLDTFINGKPARFYFDDPLDAAAYGALPASVNSLVQLSQSIARTLRAGVTLVPGFAVGQVLTDLTRAYALSDVAKPAALIPRILMNFPVAAYGELTGRKGAAIKRLENLGVAATFDVSTQGTIKNIMQEVGAEGRGIVGSILHFAEAISKGSDIAVRKAIYEQSMKETGNDEALSTSRAREIINFSRRGKNDTVDFLVRTVPFTNAYIRGMDKLYTAATGTSGAYGMTQKQARSMFMGRIGTLAAMGFVYAAMMAGDDEYESLDDSIRDSRIILPFKIDGAIASIPLPRDLAFMFKAIPERVVNYVRKYGTEDEQNGMLVIGELLRQGLLTVAAPSVIPSAITPVLENITNKSFFLDRPLESQSQQGKEEFRAFGRGTSEVSKELSNGMTVVAKQFRDMGLDSTAEMFEVSPVKIENLIRGWFGTSAALALSIGDSMLAPERTAKSPHKEVLAQITGLSAVMTDPVGRKQLNEFYDLYDRISKFKKTLNDLEANDPEEAIKYKTERVPEMEVVDYMESLHQSIQDRNATIRLIDKDKDITADQKLKAVSEIVREQNEIAKETKLIKRHLLKRE